MRLDNFIPFFIPSGPRAACGCRKFQIDSLGDHISTCTAHSGAKKAHDWTVDPIADLFRTTHKVKTQQVIKSRGQHCGDIELAGYLANAAGPVPVVLDLRIAMTAMGVVLTLVLTDICVILMI